MVRIVAGAIALLAIAAVVVTVRPAPAGDVHTPAQVLASTPAPQLLTKVPIDALFGRDGIRPSPNGELVAVVRAPKVPVAPPIELAIYDLTGREVAASRGTAIGGSAWLSDSSGLLLTSEGTGEGGSRRFDARILGIDGSLRTVARGVSFPAGPREVAVGPGGRLLFSRCCPTEIIAAARDGSGETVVARGEGVRALGFDGSGQVLYADLGTAEVVTASTDGRVVTRAFLRPPADRRLIEVSAWQSPDRRATLVGFRADRTFEGGGQNGYGSRLFVDGALRDAFPGFRTDLAVGPHEVVASTPSGPVRYDLVSGASSPIHLEPGAISRTVIYASGSVNATPRIRIARLGDAAWREIDLPFDVQPWSAIPRPLTNGAFFIFDAPGALWSLDGEVALAQSSTTLPECRSTHPDPPEARKPFPATTADEVRAGIDWDPAYRHMVEDVAGTRQDANPLRDPAVPRCRVDLLAVGQPMFVARATGGTWLVPVTYQGRAVVTALVPVKEGKGLFAGTRGGTVVSMAETDARRIGSVPNDAVVRARLVFASAGRGPDDQIAWELTRASGAVVYLFPGYPGAGLDGRLFDAREVQLAR